MQPAGVVPRALEMTLGRKCLRMAHRSIATGPDRPDMKYEFRHQAPQARFLNAAQALSPGVRKGAPSAWPLDETPVRHDVRPARAGLSALPRKYRSTNGGYRADKCWLAAMGWLPHRAGIGR